MDGPLLTEDAARCLQASLRCTGDVARGRDQRRMPHVLLHDVQLHPCGHRMSAMCRNTNKTLICTNICKCRAGSEAAPRLALRRFLPENNMLRSDWIKAGIADKSPEAHEQLKDLPPQFFTGEIYIDYVFPD